MTYMFFDTETTGLPDFKLEPKDSKQPRIVQLAAIVADQDGNELSAVKFLIKPDGYTIDEQGKAFQTHGISNAIANQYGVSIKTALAMFSMMECFAKTKIAHNYRFDGFILKGEYERTALKQGPQIDKFCTMKAMTEIMKLPPTDAMVKAGFNKPKSPNLGEAYKFCTGKDLEGAHDALVDVRACKDVFFWILKNGHFKDQPRVVPTAGGVQ